MASLHRTIARNIARELMVSKGIKHFNRKGYAVDPKNEINVSKSYKRTLTSLFALNWRSFLPSALTPAYRKPRESRKPFLSRKRAKEA